MPPAFEPFIDSYCIVMVVPVALRRLTWSVRQYTFAKSGDRSEIAAVVSCEGFHGVAEYWETYLSGVSLSTPACLNMKPLLF